MLYMKLFKVNSLVITVEYLSFQAVNFKQLQLKNPVISDNRVFLLFQPFRLIGGVVYFSE
jgi:hypothetical protein